MYLKKLELNGFRGFLSFATDAFAPFTIIGGRNNTGKTSLLEAIYSLANRSVGIVPGQLMMNRKMSLRRRDLSPLFYNLHIDTPLAIDSEFSDKTRRWLSIEVAEQPMIAVQLAKPEEMEDVRNATSPFFEQRWHTQFTQGEKAEGISEVFFTRDEYKVRDIEFKVKTPEGEKPPKKDFWKCFYYRTRSLGNMQRVYKELFKRKKDRILLGVLKSIDNRIKDVAFDGDQVLIDVGISDARLPIEVMGDGSVKVADIIALAALAKQGDVICIDEIENGLHHSFMGTFVKSLAMLIKDYGIQIIATTHNLELMQSIVEQDAKDFRKGFSYINLARTPNGSIVPTAFSYGEFAANLENEIDIR